MSLLDQLKKANEEEKMRSSHPLIKMGADRNIRDAYFHGLVFAAFADDDRIDDSEQSHLSDVGLALGLDRCDVKDTIASLIALPNEEKIALIRDVTTTLRGSGTEVVFLCDLSLLRFAHGGNVQGQADERSQFIEMMGTAVNRGSLALFDKILTEKDSSSQEDRQLLLDLFDEEVLCYSLPAIYNPDSIRQMRNAQKAEAAARQREQDRKLAKERNETELHAVVNRLSAEFGSMRIPKDEDYVRIAQASAHIDKRLIDWKTETGIIQKELEPLKMPENPVLRTAQLVGWWCESQQGKNHPCDSVFWKLVILSAIKYNQKTFGQYSLSSELTAIADEGNNRRFELFEPRAASFLKDYLLSDAKITKSEGSVGADVADPVVRTISALFGSILKD